MQSEPPEEREGEGVPQGAGGGKSPADKRALQLENLRKGTEAMRARKAARLAGLEPVADPFDLYEAMKAVLSQPAARDRTELQKVCRRNLREKPQWFQAEFAKAQAGAKAAGVTFVTPEPVAEKPLEKDVGTEKVVALVDRLLREWADVVARPVA